MSLINDSERHAVAIQRLATRLLKTQVYPSMRAAYLAARLILLDAGEIKSISKLDKISRQISRSVKEIADPAWLELTDELNQFAIYEADYYANLIGDLTPPDDDYITNYINKTLLNLQSGERVTAGLWSQIVAAHVDSQIGAINNAVRSIYASGETVQQGITRLRTLTDGLLRNQAEALVRTGVQHYATQAREALYEANDDVIKGFIYLATLDNRTSTLCAGRDGKFYDKDEQRPTLPAHWNCRSTYLAVTDSVEETLSGYRPAVGGTDGQMDPKRVRGSTNYQDFFLRQPKWWQNSAIGETRAKLVRDGGMKISQFNDMTGEPLTLAELRALDAEAFRRAGL